MKIIDYLAREHLTLTEFARRAGVSVAAMSRYISGQQIPRPEAMRRLAEASNNHVSPGDFYAPAGQGVIRTIPSRRPATSWRRGPRSASSTSSSPIPTGSAAASGRPGARRWR
ncbi:helix-turn-helix domain-containing protein [Oleomonas cavernae]|uniref:helix-turn-helix domain-containing protein n=1 Tax=Oleomonas cavernae TaxID=2320859 RepID=UPI00131411B0